MPSCTPAHSRRLLWQQSCAPTTGTVHALPIRHRQHKPQPRQQYPNSPGQLQATPRSVRGLPWHPPCPAVQPYQPTVDGDALLGSLARGTRPLQPLRASQVHKVKLGCQGLVLSSGLGSIQKAAHLLIHLQPGTHQGSAAQRLPGLHSDISQSLSIHPPYPAPQRWGQHPKSSLL